MALTIQVENFKKSFGKKVVHQDVSFNVQERECVGLLAGSGAGKSVILRSLIGLEKPDSGKILIDGTDITKYKERELLEIRKKVAYVFQGGALFDSMSVYQNLAYPLKEHTKLKKREIQKKIYDLLEDFGLAENDKLYPASLSGGMQKRVGLARAIILNPKIILYDEPTAGLDPYNTRIIQDLILRLKTRGVTSILVTHDMPTAMAVCDRILMMVGGRIVENKTIQEIKNDDKSLIAQFMSGRTD